MRVTLTIQNGSKAGTTIEVPAGREFLVGRASWADLSVPDDVRMSGRHFVLDHAGARCVLRDFRSTNGTHVDGERVTELALTDGMEITAGHTRLRVALDQAGSAVVATPTPPPHRPNEIVRRTLADVIPDDPPVATPASVAAGDFLPRNQVDRVVLEVLAGNQAGQRLVVVPGITSLVGRSDWVDLPIRGDTQMSGRHFAVECGPRHAFVADLDSTNGTRLNGARIDRALLRDGDQILAGQTTFQVRVEGPGEIRRSRQTQRVERHRDPVEETVRPPALATMRREGGEAPADQILRVLRITTEPIFAILDGARDFAVTRSVKESALPHLSLYEGDKGEMLAPWGPWLVALRHDAPFLDRLAREAWGKSWGVFLKSGRPIDELRKHFRRFLMAKLPDGRDVYFRYYDPRVLRVYLPTLTPAEAREFFGPVSSFVMEGDEPRSLVRFALTDGEVKVATLDVGSA